jgi:hypothetical protein
MEHEGGYVPASLPGCLIDTWDHSMPKPSTSTSTRGGAGSLEPAPGLFSIFKYQVQVPVLLVPVLSHGVTNCGPVLPVVPISKKVRVLHYQ